MSPGRRGLGRPGAGALRARVRCRASSLSAAMGDCEGREDA